MKQRGMIFVLSLIVAFQTGGSTALAAPTPRATHWAADHSFMNRKTNVINLRGNAYFSRDNEELHADEIDLNLDTEEVAGRGRVIYQYGHNLIRAEAIEVNLKSKTGIVHNGNLTNGQMALKGEELHLLDENHMIIKQYEYTTCVDCPNSWSLFGEEADLTFEGYAYIKDFIFKVKDASLLWFPYMIVPLKTKRQSGLLFPRFSLNDAFHGSYYVQPYFWATNSFSDMTFGAGYYGNRGIRSEWEGRYALTPRSQGTANFFWTKDKNELGKLNTNVKARAAGKVILTQELPWGIEGKLRYYDVSDSGYPIEFSEDMPGRLEPVLSSELFFTKNDPDLSTMISFRRHRNLLFYDRDSRFTAGFDPDTVQELPRVVVNTNNQYILGSKVAAGVEARFNRFVRSSGALDKPDNLIENETVREANRVTLIPNVYTTLNPWPWLSVVPSVQYRSFFYTFNSENYPDLATGYLLAQTEASFQIEKFYESDDKTAPVYKNTIKPLINYSVIPVVQQSRDHPFISLIQGKAGTGRYFDNSDIVPLGASQNLESYFTPLGHSLSYGFVSELYRKKQATETTPTVVNRLVEFGANQTWDIRETQRGGIQFSPVASHLLYTEGKFEWGTNYTYYLFLDRYSKESTQLMNNPSPHRVSSYVKWELEKTLKNNKLFFERSIEMDYSYSRLSSPVSSMSGKLKYSLNDYLLPSVEYIYDYMAQPRKMSSAKVGLLIQNPSQCWWIDVSASNSIESPEKKTEVSFKFGLDLNGNAIGGVGDNLRNN